jgi:hypothetical protein
MNLPRRKSLVYTIVYHRLPYFDWAKNIGLRSQ